MPALTTRQRDLLNLLLDANAPLGAADLASQMQLTPRQVSYDLKGVRQWLAKHNVSLNATPGIGIELIGQPQQFKKIAHELAMEGNFQLILTADERQQLLAILLLTIDEPVILYQLQQLAQVSRTTILKDLDIIESWLSTQSLVLERRPNYGFWIEGSEQERRQTLATLMWSETIWPDGIVEIVHGRGLIFPLAADAHLLPLVKQTADVLDSWEVVRSFGQVAYAEAQLGGRFTDDAVLHLALTMAIQSYRNQKREQLTIQTEHINWLKTLAVWPIASKIANHLSWRSHDKWPPLEIAGLAISILTAPRNDRWPDDLALDKSFTSLIDSLMEAIGREYKIPNLTEDNMLRDGLTTYIIPACLRQRFNIWLPQALFSTTLSPKYALEREIAHKLAHIVAEQTDIELPEHEINSLTLLLRAAYIRERPTKIQQVVVVCPSGMATAQLLVARLKARFPRLGNIKVLSIRELSKTDFRETELIISTAPLPYTIPEPIEVIQVHPLLLPEDIEKITQRLA